MIIDVLKEFQNKLFHDLLAVKTFSNLNIEKTRQDFAELIKDKILNATMGIIISDSDMLNIITIVSKVRRDGYKDLTKDEKLYLLTAFKGNISNIAGVHEEVFPLDDAEYKEIAFNDKIMLVESPVFEIDHQIYETQAETFDSMESLSEFINKFDGDTYIFSVTKGVLLDVAKYTIRYARLTKEFKMRESRGGYLGTMEL